MMNTRRIAIAALSFLILEVLLFSFIDRPLSEWLRAIDKNNPALIDIFRTYTDLGKSYWYLWPSGLGTLLCAIVVRRKSMEISVRRRVAKIGDFLLFLFISVIVSGIVTDIIKPILGRARPVELGREGIYGFYPFTFDAKWNSLPSGHGTTAFAVALTIVHFYPRLRVPAFLFAFALMLSRVMVNAHYASDVIAGAAVAFLCIAWLKAMERKNGIFFIKRCFFPIDAPPSAR